MEVGQLAAGQHPDPVVPPALRGRRQAHAAGGHRGPGAAPRHRAVALPRARRDPGRSRAQANHRLIKAQRCPDAGSWQGKRIVMIKGRRARNVRGSLHGDRSKRWARREMGFANALCAHARCGAGSIPPARIEVRPSAGSNARHAPTSDQDASASRHCFTGSATRRHRHEVTPVDDQRTLTKQSS